MHVAFLNPIKSFGESPGRRMRKLHGTKRKDEQDDRQEISVVTAQLKTVEDGAHYQTGPASLC